MTATGRNPLPVVCEEAMVEARRPMQTIKNISGPVSTTAESAHKPSQSRSSVTPSPPQVLPK